jgi:hypothetical protein
MAALTLISVIRAGETKKYFVPSQGTIANFMKDKHIDITEVEGIQAENEIDMTGELNYELCNLSTLSVSLFYCSRTLSRAKQTLPVVSVKLFKMHIISFLCILLTF